MRKVFSKRATVGKQPGVIKRDLKEFVAKLKLRKPTAQSAAYHLQKSGYVDPAYRIKKPKFKKPKVKKLKIRKKHKGKGQKQQYIIRGGKAYPIG